jgi:hypothetical protein
MNEKEAKRIFDNSVALSKILGGDLKTRCLEKGMSEQHFEMLFTQYQRMSEFIARHDSEGNLKQLEPGS